MSNDYIDMADYLDKYPPCQICDEFDGCADYYDRHSMDMPCVDCDEYRELVEMEEREKNNA